VLNANDDREKNSTERLKREMDFDEDGFECILQIKKKVALEDRKEDGPDTNTLSPAKLTLPASDNASNQRVITPSLNESSTKHSRMSRSKNLFWKMSPKGSINTMLSF
jgi:hypothetical protein